MTTIELYSNLTIIHNNESHINTKTLSGNMPEAPGQRRILAQKIDLKNEDIPNGIFVYNPSVNHAIVIK